MHVITGGTGRLGKHLVERLLSQGKKVKVLARSKKTDLPEGVIVHKGDITKPETLEGFVGSNDTFFHLASVIDTKLSDRTFYEVNVLGTTNALKACRGKEVKRFVYVSSVSVFGYPEIIPADERCPKKPISKYGKSKMLAEEVIARQWRIIKSSILRPGMMYGPGFEEGYLPVLKALGKGKMPILGNGENHIPLVHVSDVVDALLLVADHEDAEREDFNLAGPGYPTQRELFKIACSALGVKEPTRSVPLWLAKTVLPILSASSKYSFSSHNLDQLTKDRAFDSTKIKKKLEFQPKTSLSQGIKEMVEYYRERGLIS